MNARLIAAYRFHKEHAGYVVGRRAECALELARAEMLLEEADAAGVARVEWVDDEEPYDPGDICTVDEAYEKFGTNEWTGPYGCVLRVNDEHTESLWGIVVGPRGTGDPYCRVVAAELASEAAETIRAALADTREGAGLA